MSEKFIIRQIYMQWKAMIDNKMYGKCQMRSLNSNYHDQVMSDGDGQGSLMEHN